MDQQGSVVWTFWFLCLFVVYRPVNTNFIKFRPFYEYQYNFQSDSDVKDLGMFKVDAKVDPETMKSGPPPLFSLEQEARLVNHIKKMSHLGYGYTRVEVTALASDYAVNIRLKDKTDKQLSLQWFRSFIDRWPDLKLQKPRALSISRAKGASKEVIDSYFDELEDILNKYDLKNKLHCIYNIDEKGISPEHTPPKVVADVEINSSAVTSEGETKLQQS
ncbi:unnamed protein product [Mytilus coruscus]|uniref:Uncharacterized protein n=1 Tax=Mytilus coruscus TaxID=42192 RepID=A0A6J8A9R5_MYTCO|nr:unnamed protein product [Mytilus coruscus]